MDSDTATVKCKKASSKHLGKRKKRKKRHSSSSSEQWSEDSSDSNDSYKHSKKKKKHSHRETKLKKHSHHKKKHAHHDKVKAKKRKSPIPAKVPDSATSSAPPPVVPGSSSSSKPRGPMTREEYEKQQSVVRRVFDPDTGRHRLVKGDGEIIEEIVSKDRHKAINKMATLGDGLSFQSQLRKLQ